MVERTIRRPNRVRMRRPLPPPPTEARPVPHTSKKPKLAVTGTKVDRLCSICLGRLEPGDSITFCECGKFFHFNCITEVLQCPLCNLVLFEYEPVERPSILIDEPEEGNDSDLVEVVFQCPECGSYVAEDAEKCQCGAVFDSEEAIYLCPDCGEPVSEDADRCESCGLNFA